VTYLHRDCIGTPIHIRGSEAKQAEADPDEAILAAIVSNQPITVIATVVFDRQALKAIQQVWTAYETASMVVDGNLNLRPWEPGKHEQHPQPGLHCGFGLRVGRRADC
jgi:hypothetical protein